MQQFHKSEEEGRSGTDGRLEGQKRGACGLRPIQYYILFFLCYKYTKKQIKNKKYNSAIYLNTKITSRQ